MFVSFRSCCTCCKRKLRPLSFWMERVERRIWYNLAVGGLDFFLTIYYYHHINAALKGLGFVTALFSTAVSVALYRVTLDNPRPRHDTILYSIGLLFVAWSLWFTQMVYVIVLSDTTRDIPPALTSMAYFGQASTASTYYMLFKVQDALDRYRAETHQTSFMTEEEADAASNQNSGGPGTPTPASAPAHHDVESNGGAKMEYSAPVVASTEGVGAGTEGGVCVGSGYASGQRYVPNPIQYDQNY